MVRLVPDAVDDVPPELQAVGEVAAGGVVHPVHPDRAATRLRAQCVDERLAHEPDARWFAGASRERHRDVRAGLISGCGRKRRFGD